MSALHPAGPDAAPAVAAEVDDEVTQSRGRQSTAVLHPAERHVMIPPAAGTVDPADVALPGWAADADGRGSLEIAPLVLRRIVEHAADQVPGILHRGRRVGGLEVGEEGPRARVSPSIPADTGTADAEQEASLDVRLDLTLTYPAPVRATVDAVRATVAAELTRLAGYRLGSFAVRVVALHSPHVPRTVVR